MGHILKKIIRCLSVSQMGILDFYLLYGQHEFWASISQLKKQNNRRTYHISYYKDYMSV